MKLKVFTLRMNPAFGTFDDRGLLEFQTGKDVIEVSEHFLVHEKTPTLVLVLHYRDLPDPGRGRSEAPRKDWRGELDKDGKHVYDELRLWRGRKAKREGLPPYLILNNRELAELAMKKPTTIAKLRETQGIGEGKAARWGEEILTVLAQANLRLEKLRVLLRISHEERYLDHKGFEHAARNIDEAGRMIGGWLRSRGAP